MSERCPIGERRRAISSGWKDLANTACEVSRTAFGPVVHEAESIIDPHEVRLIESAERRKRWASFSTAGKALPTPIRASRIKITAEQRKILSCACSRGQGRGEAMVRELLFFSFPKSARIPPPMAKTCRG